MTMEGTGEVAGIEAYEPQELADLIEADMDAVYAAVTDPMLELFRKADGSVDMEAYLDWVYRA